MLNKHLSLSQRVKLTFIASFSALSIMSMMLVYAALKINEDHIFETELTRSIQHYQQAELTNANIHLPLEISVYTSKSDIPHQIAQFMSETKLGVYELDHPDDLDYHYAIAKNSNGQQLFFIYDVNAFELSEKNERDIFRFITLGFISSIIIFFFIFKMVIRRALAPMYQLIAQVKRQTAKPEHIIDYTYPDDNELGLLNNTLKNYSQRIESFIQREREFSSFASHELRTPVTIIKGATELLQLRIKDQPQIKKPLARIHRATHNMEDMITMLLDLSREQQQTASQCQTLEGTLQQTLNAFQESAQQLNKNIKVTGNFSANTLVEKIPAGIILSNMLRNAIQHSISSDINIHLAGNTCIVNNIVGQERTNINNTESPIQCSTKSKPPLNKPKILKEQGFGLGKLIIKRISRRHNWQYKEWFSEDKIFVEIDFS